MQETMMPTYVVCWWSLRQDGNSVERWNRMELRMMVALYACWRAGHERAGCAAGEKLGIDGEPD